MIYVAIYGAFERLNYGDLLFPNVLEKLFKKAIPGAQLLYLSLIETDLSLAGGKTTYTLHTLSHLIKPGDQLIFIHAGGEILSCPANYALAADLPHPISNQLSLLNGFNLEYFSRMLLNLDMSFPYVVSKSLIQAANSFFIFNSVGGSNISNLSEEDKSVIRDRLLEADILAVRDEKTFISLQIMGLNPILYPDAAVTIKSLFSEEVKQKFESNWFSEHYEAPYMVIQLNNSVSKADLKEFAIQIKSIQKEKNLKVVLLPIGTASLHDDQKALNQLQFYLGNPSWCRLENQFDIFSIMAIIARARLYAGTSLHGWITASSFGIPRLSFSTGITKLRAYIDTWENDLPIKSSSFSKFYHDGLTALRVPKDRLAIIAQRNYEKYTSFISEVLREAHLYLGQSPLDRYIKVPEFKKEKIPVIAANLGVRHAVSIFLRSIQNKLGFNQVFNESNY